ncbi:MAG: hypothetical protein JEZ00_07575 [Anaerolineaceae bacterium]|nr:hypothetical protein [Anaerolineaceae bacterium]
MQKIKFYFRASCPHSQLLLRSFKKNQVEFDLLDVASSPEFSEELKTVADGNLSVPTLLFPDGEIMIEPSTFSSIRFVRKHYPELIKPKRKSWFHF